MCYNALFPYISAAGDVEEVCFPEAELAEAIEWLNAHQPQAVIWSTEGLETCSRREALGRSLAFARLFGFRYPAYAGRLRFREGCGCGDYTSWWRPEELARELDAEEDRALAAAVEEALTASGRGTGRWRR